MENFEFEKKIKGGTLWYQRSQNIFFSLFQNFKILFQKMASIGRGKWSKKQSHKIWACLEHTLRNQERSSTRGGSPPLVDDLSWYLNKLKFYDFVFLNISHILLKSFLKKEFWNFEKVKKKFWLSWHQRVPPLNFFFKFNFFHFSSNKSYFFYLTMISSYS